MRRDLITRTKTPFKSLKAQLSL